MDFGVDPRWLASSHFHLTVGRGTMLTRVQASAAGYISHKLQYSLSQEYSSNHTLGFRRYAAPSAHCCYLSPPLQNLRWPCARSPTSMPAPAPIFYNKDWVLVKEFSLKYHSRDLLRIIGFLTNCGNPIDPN